MSDLKPCPFCGGETLVYFNGWGKEDTIKNARTPSMSCLECGVTFEYGVFGGAISDVIARSQTEAAWNRRSTEPDTIQKLVERYWKLLESVREVRDVYQRQLDTYNETPETQQTTWAKSKCYTLSVILSDLTRIIAEAEKEEG